MYTEEDLDYAVDQGALSRENVAQFRALISQRNNSHSVDEENFRLISGFNDVFVVIACALVLASIAWLTVTNQSVAGAVVFCAAAWGLAEFFVLRRRMALPAIFLLLAFVGGAFAIPIVHADGPSTTTFAASAVFSIIAAAMHWRRFRVPITVAAAIAAIIACITGYIGMAYPFAREYLQNLMLIAGLGVFSIAMYWDSKDPTRQSRYSDVAFWLHLLAAPMIVHPIFSSLGILDGVESMQSVLLVIGLYIALAIASIIVDRRAIMVSALVYVLYAFSSLFETYGIVGYSFAITGICVGSLLLLLSAFWHSSREKIMTIVPNSLQAHLPVCK